ncbi:hypothetical protein AX17_004936 [Amanita inopinata Kibby_2008]|nr:hypothetical protein AX17_004936 [Amanita inopinata Kibby_2008]
MHCHNVGDVLIDLSDCDVNAEHYSDRETDMIRQSLSHEKENLRRVEAQIAHLLRKQQVITDRIRRCDAALAPHKKLPEEILREIFCLCAAERVTFPLSWKGKNGPGQLVISQVCTPWRRIVLNIPELWSSIEVKKNMHNLSSIDVWLSRAKHVSLTIPFEDDQHQRFRSLSEHLSSKPYRIKELTLSAYADILPEIAQLPKQALSDVKKLSIILRRRSDTEVVTVPLFSDPARFPQLEHLYIAASAYIRFDAQNFSLVWSRLRYLKMVQIPFPLSACFAALRESILLEQCSIYVGDDSVYDPAPVHEITVPRLQILELKFQNGKDFETLMRPLLLPSLRELSIGESAVPLSPEMCNYLAPRLNFDRLEKLAITETTVPLCLGTLLNLTPSLSHIKLPRACVIDDMTTDKLAIGVLGPRLQTFDAKFSSSCHGDKMFAMVETRLKHVGEIVSYRHGMPLQISPLKSVMFQYIPGTIDEAQVFLRISKLIVLHGIEVKAWKQYH